MLRSWLGTAACHSLPPALDLPPPAPPPQPPLLHHLQPPSLSPPFSLFFFHFHSPTPQTPPATSSSFPPFPLFFYHFHPLGPHTPLSPPFPLFFFHFHPTASLTTSNLLHFLQLFLNFLPLSPFHSSLSIAPRTPPATPFHFLHLYLPLSSTSTCFPPHDSSPPLSIFNFLSVSLDPQLFSPSRLLPLYLPQFIYCYFSAIHLHLVHISSLLFSVPLFLSSSFPSLTASFIPLVYPATFSTSGFLPRPSTYFSGPLSSPPTPTSAPLVSSHRPSLTFPIVSSSFHRFLTSPLPLSTSRHHAPIPFPFHPFSQTFTLSLHVCSLVPFTCSPASFLSPASSFLPLTFPSPALLLYLSSLLAVFTYAVFISFFSFHSFSLLFSASPSTLPFPPLLSSHHLFDSTRSPWFILLFPPHSYPLSFALLGLPLFPLPFTLRRFFFSSHSFPFHLSISFDLLPDLSSLFSFSLAPSYTCLLAAAIPPRVFLFLLLSFTSPSLFPLHLRDAPDVASIPCGRLTAHDNQAADRCLVRRR